MAWDTEASERKQANGFWKRIRKVFSGKQSFEEEWLTGPIFKEFKKEEAWEEAIKFENHAA